MSVIKLSRQVRATELRKEAEEIESLLNTVGWVISEDGSNSRGNPLIGLRKGPIYIRIEFDKEEEPEPSEFLSVGL